VVDQLYWYSNILILSVWLLSCFDSSSSSRILVQKTLTCVQKGAILRLIALGFNFSLLLFYFIIISDPVHRMHKTLTYIHKGVKLCNHVWSATENIAVVYPSLVKVWYSVFPWTPITYPGIFYRVRNSTYVLVLVLMHTCSTWLILVATRCKHQNTRIPATRISPNSTASTLCKNVHYVLHLPFVDSACPNTLRIFFWLIFITSFIIESTN
jgi:hypothetical protein